jgi:hypothetical protein
MSSSNVRAVHVTWTINGSAADATSCASSPDLDIYFYTAHEGSNWGYAPVPCREGRFTVDKLPTWFDEVELAGAWGTIDPMTGEASIDLP